jgi:vitamin B12 transporter
LLVKAFSVRISISVFIFALQKMIVRDKLILLCLICFCIAAFTQGQNDSIVMLGEVVISGTNKEALFRRFAGHIRIVQKEEIQSIPAVSIQEVLSYVPGVDVRQRGVAGVQADVGIRGGSSEQTLVMVNGIKLTDPQTAHHVMNIALPLSSVERIEVMKGSVTGLIGHNAFAGAVNIITRLPESFSVKMHGFAGDFGLLGGSIVADVPLKKLKQSVSASFNTSDGYMHNTDFRIADVFYDGGMRLGSKSELRMTGGYSDRRFGANGFYSDRFPDQWESVQTLFGALIYKYSSDKLSIQGRGLFRENKDEFRLKRYDPQFYTNIHTSDIVSFELNGGYVSRFGKSGFGTEIRQEFLESTNLGNRERHFLGVFGEHQAVFLKKFDVRGGAYLNNYHWAHVKLFPGVELGYQISKPARIYAGFGMSYRIPSFTELYYRDPANESNPFLLPEEALNYEGGIVYDVKHFRIDGSGYVRDSENLIDWVRMVSDSVPNPNKWRPLNSGKMKFSGFEMSVNYHFLLKTDKFHLRNLRLSYGYIHADIAHDDGVESKYALSFLKQQFVGSFDAHIGGKVVGSFKCRFADRQNTSSYFLVDAKLSYNIGKKIRLYVEAVNLTNMDYIEAGFIRMPGRWVRGGVIVNS